MPPIIIQVASPDSTFLDFYERLAHSLKDAGTVYTPHPVIPPHIRMATPPPRDVLVALDSTDSFTLVQEAARYYLEGGEGRRLTLRSDDRTVRLGGPDGMAIDVPEALARELFAGEAG